MTEAEALKLALAAALFLAFVALIGWSRARSRTSRENRARSKVAVRGEKDAERLLVKLGYVVVDRQVTHTWQMTVDGEIRDVRCRADLLVRPRRDKHALFVAEVKTGDRVTDPTYPGTRRQLLEYSMAFDVDGVLLLDMDKRVVHTIGFPDANGRGLGSARD